MLRFATSDLIGVENSTARNAIFTALPLSHKLCCKFFEEISETLGFSEFVTREQVAEKVSSILPFSRSDCGLFN